MWDDCARLEEGRLLSRRKEDPLPSVLDGDFFMSAIREEIGDLGDAGSNRGRR